MKKPRLSFYTNIPTPYQLSFFNELAVLFDLKVIYYSSTESNRQWNFDLNEKYEVVILQNNFIARIFQKWILDFHFSWQIFSISLKDKSDYIIVGGGYWIPNSVIALLINKMRSKKIAYFSEPLFSTKNKIKYAIKWLCLRILNICCNAIFCIGKRAIESFEKFNVNKRKFIVPYNIAPQGFQDLNEEKLASLMIRFKPNDEVVILSSGSLIERKGMDVLISAFKKIDLKNARLLIIGSGPEEDNLRSLAGNDKRIIFAGFQTPEEVSYFFAIADIFSLASRYDGWGVVVNEAIAANLPMICSNRVGAGAELITSEDYGILCESEDIPAFKLAMETLLLDSDRRMKMKDAVQHLVPLISSKFYAERVYNIFLNQLN